RAHLEYKDLVWVRRELKVYGPIPIAPLFGPAFAAWVAQPPASLQTASAAAFRLQALRSALNRWPRSIWADGIAFSLADEEGQNDPEAGARDYFAVADRYPRSPYAPKALVEVVRIDKLPIPMRMLAARRLLSDYARTPEAERGADLLRTQYPGQVTAAEMQRAAVIAVDTGPSFRRPAWLLTAAPASLD